MKNRYYFAILVAVVLFGHGAESHAQEKSRRPPALPGDDRTEIRSKNIPVRFEQVRTLAIDASGKFMFVGTPLGLFRSDDSGRSWQKVGVSTKQSNYDVIAITPDPRDAKLMYIGTREAGVLKSADGGLSWKEINTGIRGPDVRGLAIDPNSPSKLYAAVREKGAGIYRTNDGGAKWARVDGGPQGEIEVLTSVNIPTGMGGIFLYAGGSTGLQRSPDCF